MYNGPQEEKAQRRMDQAQKSPKVSLSIEKLKKYAWALKSFKNETRAFKNQKLSLSLEKLLKLSQSL